MDVCTFVLKKCFTFKLCYYGFDFCFFECQFICKLCLRHCHFGRNVACVFKSRVFRLVYSGPGYNTVIFLRVAKRSPWLVFLTLVPYISLVFSRGVDYSSLWYSTSYISFMYYLLYVMDCISLIVPLIGGIGIAKAFGKNTVFGIGLFLLPFIFYPILAFGNAEYTDDDEGF